MFEESNINTRKTKQKLIEEQQRLIEQLQQEIERLKLQQQSNSQTSSKPPSTDLIQKSEKPKTKNEAAIEGKRTPGGQPGHPGKTRSDGIPCCAQAISHPLDLNSYLAAMLLI